MIITRLVDTMSNNPRPTRAEATDVANAVMDGADAFMLGAETLRGGFRIQSSGLGPRLGFIVRVEVDGADAFMLGAETLRGGFRA